jgi:hypothetical protein
MAPLRLYPVFDALIRLPFSARRTDASDNRRVPSTAAEGGGVCLGVTTTGVLTKLASAIIYNQRDSDINRYTAVEPLTLCAQKLPILFPPALNLERR